MLRSWWFNPIAFYPLCILLAVTIVTLGVRPQAWPRPPAPVAASRDGEALVFENDGFNSPDTSPEQTMTVVRDFFGNARALRLAQLPGQPPPTPAERGVRILLTREDAAIVEGRPVLVEVTYSPSTINAAAGLAASVQGIGPAEWQSVPIPPEPGVVTFNLPPQFAVDAVGFRALSDGTDQAYGLEIQRVRIFPQAVEVDESNIPE